MSAPKFVQIVTSAGHYGHYLYALDTEGHAWQWDQWRPSNFGGDYQLCWNRLDQTYDEAFPKPPAPKPKLEDCLVHPPTIEEEAHQEVERLLA